MPYVMPFAPSLPFQEITTVIEDETYVITLLWNTRDNSETEETTKGSWSFSVADADGPVVHGVKIALGIHLGYYCTHKLFREGIFVAIDTSNQKTEATLDDLGEHERVQVRYYTIAEIASGEPE